MILRELFYFSRETAETKDDTSFQPQRDVSVVKDDDTRKTRLTLSQINELRKATELHIKEQQLELDFISRMYAAPVEPQ